MAILRAMDDATQDARMKHLVTLAAKAAAAAPPSDALMSQTLDALRTLVFPQLRPASVSGHLSKASTTPSLSPSSSQPCHSPTTSTI